MALLAKASSLACLFVLTFLALASISYSRPVTEISRSGTLHARNPDPVRHKNTSLISNWERKPLTVHDRE